MESLQAQVDNPVALIIPGVRITRKDRINRVRLTPEGREYESPLLDSKGKLIPRWLKVRKELCLEAKLLYVTYNSLASTEKGAFPSNITLATKDIGCRIKNIPEYRNALEQYGLIAVTDRGSHRSRQVQLLTHEWMIGAKYKNVRGEESVFNAVSGIVITSKDWDTKGGMFFPARILKSGIPMVARLCFMCLRGKYRDHLGYALVSHGDILTWVNSNLGQSGRAPVNKSTVHRSLCLLETRGLVEGIPQGGRMAWRFPAQSLN